MGVSLDAYLFLAFSDLICLLEDTDGFFFCVSFVLTNEFSVLLQGLVSHELKAYLSVFDIFLIQ